MILVIQPSINTFFICSPNPSSYCHRPILGYFTSGTACRQIIDVYLKICEVAHWPVHRMFRAWTYGQTWRVPANIDVKSNVKSTGKHRGEVKREEYRQTQMWSQTWRVPANTEVCQTWRVPANTEVKSNVKSTGKHRGEVKREEYRQTQRWSRTPYAFMTWCLISQAEGQLYLLHFTIQRDILAGNTVHRNLFWIILMESRNKLSRNLESKFYLRFQAFNNFATPIVCQLERGLYFICCLTRNIAPFSWFPAQHMKTY
jgi:hypothetical protein